MHHYIVLLSDLSYQIGLIGIAEYEERHELAHWLSMDGEGNPDPRSGQHEEPERPRENDEIRENDGVQRRGRFRFSELHGRGSDRSMAAVPRVQQVDVHGWRPGLLPIGAARTPSSKDK